MRLTPRHHFRTRTRGTTSNRAGSPAPATRPHRAIPRSPSADARHTEHRCTGTARTVSTTTLARQPRNGRRRRVVLLSGWLVATSVLMTSSAARAETVHYVALAATVDQVLNNIRDWIMGILAGVAVVFITIGGLRYLMASGDPGEIEKAKGAFKAAGIGFGLAALAPLVVEIFKGIVGGV